MNVKVILAIALCLLVASCTAEPVTIVQTKLVESTVEVPVTVKVTRPEEVTRQVEVTVETVRELEVTREVPVVMTRLVEVVVTATPTPTNTPEPTNTPLPASAEGNPPAPSPSGNIAASLLQSALSTAENIGGITDRMLHACRISYVRGMGEFSCGELVGFSDAIVNAPTFDVSGSPQVVRDAYER